MDRGGMDGRGAFRGHRSLHHRDGVKRLVAGSEPRRTEGPVNHRTVVEALRRRRRRRRRKVLRAGSLSRFVHFNPPPPTHTHTQPASCSY